MAEHLPARSGFAQVAVALQLLLEVDCLATLPGWQALFDFAAEARPSSRWTAVAVAAGHLSFGLLRRVGTADCIVFVPDASGLPGPFRGRSG